MAECTASSTLDSLQLLEDCLRIRAVVCAAEVLPPDNAVLVDDEGGGLGDVVIGKHSVVLDDASIRVVQDGEGSAPIVCRLFRALKIVGADGENDCVVLLYRSVMGCQLDELLAAERSPECAVEYEDDVTMSSICAQRIVVSARAWQREVRR